ncbi:MAG: ABC transporter permease subunit [Chloroflexi bacterium]|nr:ABC transporter permease subunit [Chloroflexota bacterium]
MSLSLIGFTLHTQRRTLALYALGVLLYGMAIVLLFPGPAAAAAPAQDVEALPRAVRVALGISTPASLGTIHGWVAAQYLQVVWVALLGAFAIGFGSAAIARELETGTLGLLLASPLSRTTILLSKVAVLALALLGLVAATLVGLALGGLLARVAVPLERFLGVALLGFAFFFAIGAYSVLLSALANERGTALGLAAGITALFYLANFLALYWPQAALLRYVSLFSFYRPQELVQSGVVPWLDVLVLAGQAAAYLLMAASVVRERDFMV